MPQTILQQIQTILDESGGAVFWTTAEIWDAVNETLLEVWPQTNHLSTSSSWVLQTGTQFFDYPSNIMIPQTLLGTDRSHLFSTTYAKMEQFSPVWRTTTPGYAQHVIHFDIGTVRPYPLLDGTYTYTLHGMPWPPELSDASPTLTADATLVTAVAHLAAAKLLEHTIPMAADLQEREGNEVLQRYISNVRNQLANRVKRLRIANKFNVAQSGSIPPSGSPPAYF